MSIKCSLLLLLVLALAVAAASSQSVQRSSMHTGRGMKGANVSTHWTVGQPDALRFGSGAFRLTRGFEQSYKRKRTTARIITDNASGYPGDTIVSAVRLEDLEIVDGKVPSELEVEIAFNVTLLAPIQIAGSATFLMDNITDTQRIVRIRASVDPTKSDQVIATLSYVVGLGDDSTTSFQITDVVAIGPQLGLLRQHGTFSLLGICREGGPRLIDPRRVISVGQITPSPVVYDANLPISVYQNTHVRVRISTLDGRHVSIPFEDMLDIGEYTIVLPLTDSSNGVYLIPIETSESIYTQLVVVHR